MRVGTFNVRGLLARTKQNQLSRDMSQYQVDFCGLQEAKIKEPLERMISDQRRLMNFGQTDGHEGGTGFVVSKCLEQYVTQYMKLSDRVGNADFAIPSVDNTKNLVDIRFIVVYGQTTPSAQKDVHLLPREFFDKITRAQVTKKVQDASVCSWRFQQ